MTTERENYLKILRGEQPEWVPNYFDACAWGGPIIYQNIKIPGSGNPDKKIIDNMGFEYNDRERYTDWLGIEWTQTVDGAIPTPGKFTMTDITKWREQILYPFPDLDKIDYKTQADNYYAAVGHERAVAALAYGPFMDLIDSMGIEEGLCAMLEEPEAVHDFFKEITDYEEKKLRLMYPYFKPDVYMIVEDVSSAKDMFFSPELYDEIVAPYHRQLTKAALELGCFVEMHCCGKCDMLIDRWIDMGMTIWNPAQVMNDLDGIKTKYGNKFILNGCWDNTYGKGGVTGAPEKDVRESVRESIDKFALGGGFIFWDCGLTGGDVQKYEWTADEARKYGKTFYKKK